MNAPGRPLLDPSVIYFRHPDGSIVMYVVDRRSEVPFEKNLSEDMEAFDMMFREKGVSRPRFCSVFQKTM